MQLLRAFGWDEFNEPRGKSSGQVFVDPEARKLVAGGGCDLRTLVAADKNYLRNARFLPV